MYLILGRWTSTKKMLYVVSILLERSRMEREVERLEWESNRDEIVSTERLPNELKSRVVNEEREVTHLASLNLRWIFPKPQSLRACKIGRFPTWKGISPESEFPARSTYLNFERFPSWEGIAPPTKILLRSRYSNFERFPRIENPSVMLWPFDFVKSFFCSISSVSIYYFPESIIRA